MSDERVDTRRCSQIIIAACGPHRTFAKAREAGLWIKPQRDEVAALCYPFAIKEAAKIAHRMPSDSRCSKEDMESAALVGLVEGIDHYDPRNEKGAHILTYCFWTIRRNVYADIHQSHWGVMKPRREDVQAFMSNRLSQEEREAYVAMFVTPQMELDSRDNIEI